MKMISFKGALYFLLVKNPSGTLGFLIFWIVGGGYWLLSISGAVVRVDDWIMLKVLSACSLVAFFFFPIWNFLFKTKL